MLWRGDFISWLRPEPVNLRAQPLSLRLSPSKARTSADFDKLSPRYAASNIASAAVSALTWGSMPTLLISCVTVPSTSASTQAAR